MKVITQNHKLSIKNELDKILSNEEYSLVVYFTDIFKINVRNRTSLHFETLQTIEKVLDITSIGYDKDMNSMYIFAQLKNGA